MILELLDHAIPAPRRGTRVLDRALQAAGLDALPTTNAELRQFVQSALRGVLEEELGSSLAREVSADVETALAPALRRCDTYPAVPSSKRLHRATPASTRRGEGISVMVVGADRLGTASLARALVAEGFTVSVAHDDAEVAIATSSGGPRAVVLDERTALELPGSVETLIAETPGLIVLAHSCGSAAITDALLKAHGVDRTAALPRGATTRDVISALDNLTSM